MKTEDGRFYEMPGEIVHLNKIKCDACQDEIESTHVHDFRSCKCGRVFVDGGHEYRRTGWTGDGGPTYTDLSITERTLNIYTVDGFKFVCSILVDEDA